MGQITKGITFADVSPDNLVTAARLNSHVDGAELQGGAVLLQSPKAVPIGADSVLIGDSTDPTGRPKRVLFSNLLLEEQRNGTQQYQSVGSPPGTDTGTANAYAVTLAPVATAYAKGMVVRFVAGYANTTASTLAVNGLAVTAIKRRDGTALQAGDILAGQVVVVVHDGTNFQLLSRQGTRGWDYTSAADTAFPATTAAVSWTHGLTAGGAAAMPTKLRGVLVQTNAAEKVGYAQNDEIELWALWNESGYVVGGLSADATTITFVANAYTNVGLAPKGGGAGVDLVATGKLTYFKLKVYASL